MWVTLARERLETWGEGVEGGGRITTNSKVKTPYSIHTQTVGKPNNAQNMLSPPLVILGVITINFLRPESVVHVAPTFTFFGVVPFNSTEQFSLVSSHNPSGR